VFRLKSHRGQRIELRNAKSSPISTTKLAVYVSAMFLNLFVAKIRDYRENKRRFGIFNFLMNTLQSFLKPCLVNLAEDVLYEPR
jgi:hypothetical protein